MARRFRTAARWLDKKVLRNPPAKSVTEGRVVRRLVGSAKIAAVAREERSQLGTGVVLGSGISFLIQGQIAPGALLTAMGVGSHFGFRRLEKSAQQKLVAALSGRPRLTESVCRGIIEPEFETHLRELGTIYLPRQELVKLRKHVLANKRFNFAEFLHDTEPLVELGRLRTQARGLTDNCVGTTTKLLETKMEYPLGSNGKRAAKLAISMINIVETGRLRFTAAKEIATAVIRLRGGNNEAVETAIHLMGRAAAVPPGEKVVSKVLEHRGLSVELTVYPDGRKKMSIGPKGWSDLETTLSEIQLWDQRERSREGHRRARARHSPEAWKRELAD